MKLQHIDLNTLIPAKVNVRKRGAKDIGDLVPSIRALGLLQPLLVRPAGDGFEIVAGQRRYHALCAIAEEDGSAEPVPCLVMTDGDDAHAIEASLAENVARLPMDE
ncbi:MAG: ParB/Srx family N-terminal domain-containing protein [Pseudomonadota bacterium]